jgi:hypothetical protein
VIVEGDLTDAPNGRAAVSGPNPGPRLFLKTPADNTWTHRRLDGYDFQGNPESTAVDFNTAEATDYPVESDVREGIEYANGDFEGTLAVPTADKVSAGTPVDNTVGTAALDAGVVAAITGAQIAAALNAGD